MVMKSMRKNMRTLLWITAVIFIGATFMGLGSYYFSKRGDELSTDTVAQVNNKKIDIAEFSRAVDEQVENYRSYNMNVTEEMMPMVKKSVLEGMIQVELMLAEIKKQGIKVSDQEVIDKIRSVPYFQKNGRFSQELYLELLKYRGKTPQSFENDVRNAVKSEKINRLITGGIKITTAELMEEYNRRKYNPKAEMDTFKARRGMIADALMRQAQSLYYQEWANSLRNKATIINNLAKIDPQVK